MSETPEERVARLQDFANRGGTISADEYKRRSRRAFLGFVPAAVGAFLGFKHVQGRPEDGNIPDVIRRGLEFNESVWDTIGREGANARTFDISDREPLRVNGRLGMRDLNRQFQEIDLDAWRLQVIGPDGRELETLTMEPIRALPQRDEVWLHKCIEGWSSTVHWTGARFADFEARYVDDLPDYRYVSLRTPDERYYVGLDRSAIRHRQTLLAWALNGEPLTQAHGAPLRLATPNYYGIKQIKRIGTIEFTNERPEDYWAQRGYDWHARF